ncbi:DgyrCDS7788 [Dimorphilus gyrociliatus]|uniref:DgyrCDS7788 n=1 Tax=Dimorphilus gyrociliatus TaxID=2664684 RepID=A0A7I8VSB2_9ANNE|nr:DgyrCDS7788 [Dimorphilus gyrociliatus]
MALAGKICLVTGASRGIGRGIAVQLGEAGAKVYITGRTLKPKPDSKGVSLEEVAEEVQNRGGICVPVVCDHSKDSDIDDLFRQISVENDGKLDVLVNNAYAAVTTLLDTVEKKKFWQKEPANEHWDIVNNVGLRNHYICTVKAANMMVPRKTGLIINISSSGGLSYLFDVAYGVGKAALDRMSVDCGIELKKHNVTCVSLWPGAVKTELISAVSGEMDDRLKTMFFDYGESTEFSGKAIVCLASDPNVHKKTSRILITAELASEYGFKDIDGKTAPSLRWVGMALVDTKYVWLANWVPYWMKLPFSLLHYFSYKF